LLDDDLAWAPFLRVDRSSVPVPVFYRRTLPKRIKSNDGSQERQSLVIEHEPEIHEKEPVVIQKVVEEAGKVKEKKSLTKLVVKSRESKVKEIGPPLELAEKKKEPEILPIYDRVSVVMAFRGREDNRLDGLKKCIKCLRDQTIDCYIIIVEQDKIPVHQCELEPLVDSYLFIYSSLMFNKSWAFNCGAMIAPDDLILFHDCDLLTPKHYVKESIKVLGTKDIALPWAKILYLDEESSKKYPDCHLKATSTLTTNQAVGGSLLVKKNFYLRIGGMDERFFGWGGEDNAFYAKATKLGRVNRTSPVTGITLLHHYHKPAQKVHQNNYINNSILREYYQRSDKDIMLRIRTLDPIGDPLRYKTQEEGKSTEIKTVNVLSL
jgi:hypothetical protein